MLMQYKLDLYYYIDLPKETNDLSVIEKYIRVYINVYLGGEYTLNKFVNCNYLFKNNKIRTGDVIKDGLCSFDEMKKSVKLKQTHTSWFVYLSNGDIRDRYKNVFVMLLNKNPSEKVTNYSINTQILDVNKKYTKYEKIQKLDLLSSCIQELYLTDKQIMWSGA